MRNVFLFFFTFLSLMTQSLYAIRINGKECVVCGDSLFFTFNPDSMYVESNFQDYKFNGLSCDKVILKVGDYKVTDSEGNSWFLIITSLPLLEVNVKNDSYLPYYKCDTCEMAVVDARLLAPRGDEKFSEALMKVRGATSSDYAKKSFAFELIDSTGKDYETDWLGLRRSDGKYVLNAMYKDHSLMRNKVLMDAWNSFSHVHYLKKEPEVINGQRNEYVELILDGKYMGIYTLGDKINRKFLKLKKYKEDTIKGLLFKSVKHDFYSYNEEASDSVLLWQNYEAKYPGEVGKSGLPLLRDWLIKAKANEFVPDVDYDFRNIVDYTLFINAVNADDNQRKNIFFACYNYNKKPKFFVTPWDLDATLGRDWLGNEIESDITDSTLMRLTAAFEENALKSNLCYAVKRWNELKVGALSLDSISERLDSVANYIIASGANKRNNKRWPGTERNGVYVHNDVEYIKNWYAKNIVKFDSYMSQFKDFEHDVRIVGRIEPTETETGYSGDSACFKCGKIFKKGGVIPMLQPGSLTFDTPIEKVHIHVSDGLLVVENASDRVEVYNSLGGLVARNICGNSACQISLPNADVYIVKVDGVPYKVVYIK